MPPAPLPQTPTTPQPAAHLPPTPPPPPIDLQATLAEWLTLTKWIEQAKAKELELRAKLSGAAFAELKDSAGIIKPGTHRKVLPVGGVDYKFDMQARVNRTVLIESYKAASDEAGLTAEEREATFKVEVALRMTGYKALTKEQQKILDKAIVEKQGTVSLDVEPLPK